MIAGGIGIRVGRRRSSKVLVRIKYLQITVIKMVIVLTRG